MCNASELCLDAIDGNAAGIIFEALLLLYCFCALAIICDKYLVVSLETLCVRWNIREDVAGCSFMAFGSAAPEILISCISTAKGGDNTSLGVGAIIGSGLIAFAVIPGLCAIFASRTLQLKQRPLLRDATIYLLALGLLCAFFSDGVIRTWEASCLILLYFIYLMLIFFAPGAHAAYQAFTHRKKMWVEIRRAVATGVRGQDLHQLRESFLDVDPSQLAGSDEKHFVVEAAEQKERERKEQEAAAKPPRPDIEMQETKMPSRDSQHDSALADGGSGGTESGVSRGGSSGSRYETVDTEPDLESSQPSRHHTLSATRMGGADDSNGADDEDDDSVSFPSDDDPHNSSNTSADGASSGGNNIRALEAPPTLLSRSYRAFTFPLSYAFDRTCVSCEWDSPSARWYPLTFLVSFLWVSLFSFLISVVVGRWVARSTGGVSQSFFGLVLVSVGAEIPDLIQSVSVSQRGYGSMAVANSCGSQITNILIGLGLPWFLADLGADMRGEGIAAYVTVEDHSHLQIAAFFQFSNLTLFVVALLLMAVIQNTQKAQLNKKKGFMFLGAYVLCIGGYALYIFT